MRERRGCRKGGGRGVARLVLGQGCLAVQALRVLLYRLMLVASLPDPSYFRQFVVLTLGSTSVDAAPHGIRCLTVSQAFHKLQDGHKGKHGWRLRRLPALGKQVRFESSRGCLQGSGVCQGLFHCEQMRRFPLNCRLVASMLNFRRISHRLIARH